MDAATSTRGRLDVIDVLIWQLPSTMARLAWLAGLRDPNTGSYSHPSAQTAARKAEAGLLLKHLHGQAFRTWLRYSLEEQKADLDLYFSGVNCSKATAVKTWLDLHPYRSFVPASATATERQLFFSDLEVLLQTMTGPVPDLNEQMGPEGHGDPLLNTAEVAKWLGVSSRALRFLG